MIKVYGYSVEVRLVTNIYGLTVNSRFRSHASKLKFWSKFV